VIEVFRVFFRENPVLGDVMFSRPFADFDPGPAELRAGAAVREFIVARVRRGIDAGIVSGDETDVAHVVMALAQGMAAQETAGWLGTSEASSLGRGCPRCPERTQCRDCPAVRAAHLDTFGPVTSVAPDRHPSREPGDTLPVVASGRRVAVLGPCARACWIP
jgi:hypothetical protein